MGAVSLLFSVPTAGDLVGKQDFSKNFSKGVQCGRWVKFDHGRDKAALW